MTDTNIIFLHARRFWRGIVCFKWMFFIPLYYLIVFNLPEPFQAIGVFAPLLIFLASGLYFIGLSEEKSEGKRYDI